MVKKQRTTSQRVVALRETHPELSGCAIARQVGVSRQRVHWILSRAHLPTARQGYVRGVLVTCFRCGVEFRRYPSQVKIALRHFCSEECYRLWRREGIDAFALGTHT